MIFSTYAKVYLPGKNGQICRVGWTAVKSATVEAQDSISDDVLAKTVTDTGFQVVGFNNVIND